MADSSIILYAEKATITLIPSVICIGIGYIIKGVEYNRNYTSSRVDDLVDEIKKLQEVNSKYWSRVREATRTEDDFSQEGEIRARNHMINSIVTDLSNSFRPNDYAELVGLVTQLRQETSGGNFASEARREAVPHAISGGYTCGYEMISKVRKCAKHPRRVWSIRN